MPLLKVIFVPAVKLAKLPPKEIPEIVELANALFGIAVNPLPIAPLVNVPTLVRLDVTIADGNAVPARFAAGNPVVFVNVPLDGVPNAGVTNVGDVANATTVPVPVVEYDVPQADPVEFAIPAPGYTCGDALALIVMPVDPL